MNIFLTDANEDVNGIPIKFVGNLEGKAYTLNNVFKNLIDWKNGPELII